MLFRKYIILLLVLSSPVYADQYQATVIKVIDGDTIWVKSNNKHIKVRLSYIDAPELRQKHGVHSRDKLSELVLNKNVEINTYRKDRYNRHLGEVYIFNSSKSVFINAVMLKSGNAWVYKRYRNNEYLINLENNARMANKGIWSTSEPLEPWIFRRK